MALNLANPRYFKQALLCVALFGLSACASTGMAPTEKMANARASVAQAESAGALQLAPIEMLSAREKMSKAEMAVREERFKDAQKFSDEAVADAEVAERKSRVAKAERAAQELANSNAELEKELARKTPPAVR